MKITFLCITIVITVLLSAQVLGKTTVKRTPDKITFHRGRGNYFGVHRYPGTSACFGCHGKWTESQVGIVNGDLKITHLFR